MGMEFATRIPVPEIGNGIFHLHSRSRNLGMEFAVPKIQKSFPLTPDLSQGQIVITGLTRQQRTLHLARYQLLVLDSIDVVNRET